MSDETMFEQRICGHKPSWFSVEQLKCRIIDAKSINNYYLMSKENWIVNIDNIHDFPGEIWKTYPQNTMYMASNYGRIKYKGEICILVEGKYKDIKDLWGQKPSKYLLEKYPTKVGWLKPSHDEVSNLESLPFVYQIVADTWLDSGSDSGSVIHVHHISEDGYDNRPENLIYLPSEVHFKQVHSCGCKCKTYTPDFPWEKQEL